MTDMRTRAGVYVFAALALLLGAGTDLLVADLVGGGVCDGWPLPGATESFPDDDCFCCCAHIVFSTAVTSVPVQLMHSFDPQPKPAPPFREPSSLYRPPRF